ncbi:hypothetical protein PHET_12057 [Paragonimus heterotremus]|uniref:Uncharacterized protein n=1 Tax=Paragonimus heterotremus TaxID=100268 RepID=A0A8J4WD49_9TREM|nr:hypothetical protein PHET_12057 [Paragonimus heterotremus]
MSRHRHRTRDRDVTEPLCSNLFHVVWEFVLLVDRSICLTRSFMAVKHSVWANVFDCRSISQTR